MAHLHAKILGRADDANSDEVKRTFKLFAAVIQDAAANKASKEDTYFCRPGNKDAPGSKVDDPTYTIRAWRAVVTYLLRRNEFLYE